VALILEAVPLDPPGRQRQHRIEPIQRLNRRLLIDAEHAMLSAVLASSYGCDAKLALRLVFMITAISIVTVPVLFGLLT